MAITRSSFLSAAVPFLCVRHPSRAVFMVLQVPLVVGSFVPASASSIESSDLPAFWGPLLLGDGLLL